MHYFEHLSVNTDVSNAKNNNKIKRVYTCYNSDKKVNKFSSIEN